MSAVTRSTEASGGAEIRGVERNRLSQPNGWWGIVLLIATEATLLLAIVGTYYYLRFQATQGPPRGIAAPSVALPLVMMGVLLLTSVPMQLAVVATRAGRVGPTRALIVLAMLVQAGYLAVQIILLRNDLLDFSPAATAYGSIYFTMIVAHHAHVAIGLLLDVGILIRLIGGLTDYRAVGVRAIALYWHFVNLMAIIVVLTQLSPSL
jgi:heme/copper-type cytochrome/quinol oxidase subunit 3